MGPEFFALAFLSVGAEMVYFILVEARNCVELLFVGRGREGVFYPGGGQKLCTIIFRRLWPKLCIFILVEARNCAELFFLSCGWDSVFYSGGGQTLCRIDFLSVVAERNFQVSLIFLPWFIPLRGLSLPVRF